MNAILHYDGEDVELLPFNLNASFAMGCSERQEVARMRPYVPPVQWSFGELRSYLRGKMAANRQVIQPDRGGAVELLVACDSALASEALRVGYPVEKVLEVWRSLPPGKNDAASRTVRDALIAYKKQQKLGGGREWRLLSTLS